MKIIDDTLKSPNGKYSRKSLTSFVAFVFALGLGLYIVISDYIIEREINRYAIDVFQSLLLLVGATLGLTVWDKQNLYKNETDK
jgi:hypothetical protein